MEYYNSYIFLKPNKNEEELDYHTDNILIDENTRRCMIIDFGKAKKIDNYDTVLDIDIYEEILGLSNVQIILDRIFYTTFDNTEKSDEFMWLKNVDDIDIGILLYLNENRLTYIENQLREPTVP
jgi:serine/threonine protein kinase